MMTRRRKVDVGFTMIEILIAIAVIGVLAVIAIPQYQDYVIRSKVSECLNFAGPAKTAVTEAQASQRGILFNFSPTSFCANVQLAPDGTIVLTTQNTGAKEAPVLQMTPWGAGGGAKQLRWDCQFVAGEARHVPASCRTPGIAVPADKLVDSSGSGGTGGTSSDSGGPVGGAGSDHVDSDSADGGSSASDGDSDPGDTGAGAADSGGGADGGAPSDGVGSTAPPAGSGSDVVDSGDGDTSGSGGTVVGGGGETAPELSGDGSESGSGGAVAVDAGGGSVVCGLVPPDEDAKKEEPKEAEKPVEECPHKLPDGKPHPARCKDWGK